MFQHQLQRFEQWSEISVAFERFHIFIFMIVVLSITYEIGKRVERRRK